MPAQDRLIGGAPLPVFDNQPRPTAGQRVLGLLRGHWEIERRIEPGGRFTGVAHFIERSRDCLQYSERGQLMLDNGTAVRGENSYIYALRNGNIEISFDQGLSKGSRFIDIFLPKDQPSDLPIISVDQHLCRMDTYDATFRIDSPSIFTVTYVVNGPAKAYVSRSTYRRREG